ncbi:MAG: hypothetical protein GEU88_08920 [Solirubrobacterales bacterium]|nr:hypothetical protein [Solirubrobacterales bacterium]
MTSPPRRPRPIAGDRAAGPPLTAGDRALAWLVTGPLGRVGAFLGDLGAYWWRWARGRVTGRRARG